MHVDLGDYRFLSAKTHHGSAAGIHQPTGQPQPQNAGYIQLMRVGTASDKTELVTSTKNPALTTTNPDQTGMALADLPLAQALEETSHYILADFVI